MQPSLFDRKFLGIAPLFALPFLGLAGCGLGTPAVSSFQGSAASGITMGGEQPVVGAQVRLYVTAANTGATGGVYTGSATLLGQTYSVAGGAWSFPSISDVCPSGQYVYVTAYGGNGGGSQNNTSILSLALVGACGNLAAFTNINEVTTAAAAYAMSSFLSVDTTGAAPVVNIVAPAANGSQASTNNVNSGTVVKASGLAHAYANFTNLVNVSAGTAYLVPPSNANATAPAAVLNTLGNILQACVNSNGVASGQVTNCGTLFSLTLNAAGTAPTTTLQAALNLARNPYGSAAKVAGIFSLAPALIAFAPSLSAAPKDWTLAISFPVPTNPQTGLGFPFNVALDADDTVYVTSPESDPYQATATGPYNRGSASACFFGYSSNGTFLPTVVPYSGTPGGGTAGSSSWYCSTGTTSGNSLLTQAAPDALGNIYVANYGTSTYNTNQLLKINNSGMLLTSYQPRQAPVGVAVDKLNDVITSVNIGSGQNVYGFTTAGAAMSTFTATASFAQTPRQVAIDSGQNLWFSGYGATSGVAGAVVYGGESEAIGSTAAASYSTTVLKKVIANGSSSSTTTNSAVFGVALDASGNAWFTSDAPASQSSTGTIGLTKQVATGSGNSMALSTATTISDASIGFASPKFLEVDGNGVIWIADTNGIIAYASAATTPAAISESGGFSPCIPSGSSCTYPDTSSTKGVAIDSTGAVWFTTPDATITVPNSNRLIQLIGTATATWPLLATGKPGTMPQ